MKRPLAVLFARPAWYSEASATFAAFANDNRTSIARFDAALQNADTAPRLIQGRNPFMPEPVQISEEVSR